MNASDSKLHDAIRDCSAVLAKTMSGITPGQLGDRTPCEKFTVAELLDHLGQTLSSSARAARKEAQPSEPGAVATSPSDVAESAKQVVAAWGDASAYEGTTEFGPGEMPARFAATITVQELALHGWDLATATSQPFALGEGSTKTVLKVVEEIAEQAGASGAYGPPVPMSADASAFHRALAASGRNPEWSA